MAAVNLDNISAESKQQEVNAENFMYKSVN